jgi:hypothetical protein
MELLQTIALLCTLPASKGYSPYQLDRIQHACQKWYVECVEKESSLNEARDLRVCIKKREVH